MQSLVTTFQALNFARIWTAIARLLFIPILLGSLLGYGGSSHQLLELTSHFRLQYLLGTLFTLALYYFAKRRWELWLCLACLSLNAIAVVPWYLPPRLIGMGDAIGGGTQPGGLRVMVSNVLTSNRRYGDLIQYIQQEQPAVLVVLEMDPIWQQQLQALKPILPYSLEVPSFDNFGIALFSQFPLQQPQTHAWGASGPYAVPSLTAKIRINQQQLNLVATHPLPPIKPDYFTYRNQQMAEMADYIKSLSGSTIVLGDLNMSMWSPFYQKFVGRSGLKNSRQGFGVQASWPTDIPLLKIPIDHCLISPAIQVINNRIGKDIGSDHHPLIADLKI